MHEIGVSEFWVTWGRHLQRVERLEERADGLQADLAKLSQEIDHWRAWARRGLILAAIWGSLATTGANHELASSVVAAIIRALLRLPASAG